MSISEEELKEKYDSLSDQALLDIWNKDTLIETAQAVLRKVLQNRSINPPILEEPRDLEEEHDNSYRVTWVTVSQLSTGPEAHIVRARLESEDIPAVVADEHLVTANWFLSNAVGGVRVRVPYPYAEQAFAIVNELESGNLEITDEEANVRLCPRCSSDDVVEYKQ